MPLRARLDVGKMGEFATVCDCQGAGAAVWPRGYGTKIPQSERDVKRRGCGLPGGQWDSGYHTALR